MGYPIEKKHQRKPNTWWDGKLLRTRNPIKNRGGDVIPRGAIVQVEDKFAGLRIRAVDEPRVYITRCEYRNFEFMTPDGEGPPGEDTETPT